MLLENNPYEKNTVGKGEIARNDNLDNLQPFS